MSARAPTRPLAPKAEAYGASLFYRWYVVAVLMVAYTLSFIDRQILALLVEPVKADLGLSDTQLGLLQGFAFAIFYTFLGMPIGRAADLHDRRKIISIGIAFWSAMTALCGFARSYWELFLARVGVGVGEAALSPAAFSMISDYFPRQTLGRALSVYSMGVFIGSGLAFMIGGALLGWVSGFDLSGWAQWGLDQPWRVVFVAVGAPGVLVALLMLSVREPPRRGATTADQASVRAVVAFLSARAGAFGAVFAGFSLHACALYAIMAWLPAGAMRAHGLDPADLGVWLGLGVLCFGCLGLFTGGWLLDRWLARGVHDAPLKVGIISCVGVAATAGALSLFDGASATLMVAAFIFFWLALPVGVASAALQLILPNNYRALVSAAYLFTINLVGLGLGPLLPPLVNEAVGWPGDMILTALSMVVAVLALGSAAVFAIGRGAYARNFDAFSREAG